MRSDGVIALLAGLAVVALVAGLTHLSAILILPTLATKDAYSLLASQGTDHLRLLTPSKPSDSLIPYRDPATVQGVCFFDLRQAPVRVRTKTVPGGLLTLSFRTPEGKIFYSMTDRAALHDTIDIRLVTEAQLKAVEAADDEDEGLPSELRLKAPSVKGLMVVTALIVRPSEADAAKGQIQAMICAPEPLPPP